jgi:WD40 repeat protein
MNERYIDWLDTQSRTNAMTHVGHYRKTFIRTYATYQESRLRERYSGLHSEDMAEAKYLNDLIIDLRVREIDLRVHEKDKKTYDPIDSLVGTGKRAALFDLVGSGKRTLARRLFQKWICRTIGAVDFLPVWLPDPKVEIQQEDLTLTLARTVGSGSAGGFSSAMIDDWLKCGPPLLLFFELDRFPAHTWPLKRLVELTDHYRDINCILMCHSNLGWSTDLEMLREKFNLYEIERPGEQAPKAYKKNLERVAMVVAPIASKAFIPGRTLPQLLHFLCHYPEASHCKTESLVFREAEKVMMRKDLKRISRQLEYQLIDDDQYMWIMRNVIGALALYALSLEAVAEYEDPSEFAHALHDVRQRLTTELTKRVVTRSPGGRHSLSPDVMRHALESLTQHLTHSSSFLMCNDDKVQFVDKHFLAYFAARSLLFDPNSTRSEITTDLRTVAYGLADPTRPNERVAEFVAGFLSPQSVSELLAELISLQPMHDSGKLTGPPWLGKCVLSLCRGADPASPIAQALLAHEATGFDFKDDPWLLAGEIHALLMEQTGPGQAARTCVRFADELAHRLDKEQCPWLERVWQSPRGPGLTIRHSATITALHVLRDGRIVFADAVGAIMLWNWAEKKPVALFKQWNRNSTVRAFAEIFDGDRDLLASAGDDGAVRLWSVDEPERRPVYQPRIGRGKLLTLAVLNDATNNHIISGGEDGLIYAWSPNSTECFESAERHFGPVRVLRAYSGPKVQLVVSGGDDGNVRAWRIVGGRPELICRRTAPERSNMITALAVNAAHIVWGDSLGQIFSVETESPLAQLHRYRAHCEEITSLVPVHDGFVSADRGGRIYRWIWRTPDARPVSALGNSGVTYLASAPNLRSTTIVYGSADGAIGSFQLDTAPKPAADAHPGELRFLSVVPIDLPRVVTAGSRIVRVGSDQSQVGMRSVAPPRQRAQITSVALGPGFFLAGGGDGCVTRFETNWNQRQAMLLRRWPRYHDAPVTFLKVCGLHVITGSRDGKVCVWAGDLNTLERIRVWRSAPVAYVCACEEAVVWGSEDGRVSLYRFGDPEPVTLAERYRSPITALDVRWSSVSELSLDLVVARSSGRTRHITLREQKPRQFHIHSHELPATDGRTFAVRWLTTTTIVAASRAYARVLNTESGSELPLSTMKDSVTTVATSPDGQIVAIGGLNGEIASVVAATGSCSPAVNVHRDRVVALRFVSPDVVVSASWDGTVKFSRVSQNTLQVLAGVPVGGQVTALDVRDNLVLVGLASGDIAVARIHGRADAEAGGTQCLDAQSNRA